MTAEKSTHVRTYQEQPCAIPYPSIDIDPGIYIPDLLITLNDGRNLLIEIKPLWQMAVTDNRIKTQAGQRFAHNHGWGWVTIAHAGRTYHDLLHRPINPAAQQSPRQRFDRRADRLAQHAAAPRPRSHRGPRRRRLRRAERTVARSRSLRTASARNSPHPRAAHAVSSQ